MQGEEKGIIRKFTNYSVWISYRDEMGISGAIVSHRSLSKKVRHEEILISGVSDDSYCCVVLRGKSHCNVFSDPWPSEVIDLRTVCNTMWNNKLYEQNE